MDASEDDVNALVASTVPLGKVGSKWDIAIAAVFLCSSAARHLTGGACLPHVSRSSCVVYQAHVEQACASHTHSIGCKSIMLHGKYVWRPCAQNAIVADNTCMARLAGSGEWGCWLVMRSRAFDQPYVQRRDIMHVQLLCFLYPGDPPPNP